MITYTRANDSELDMVWVGLDWVGLRCVASKNLDPHVQQFNAC